MKEVKIKIKVDDTEAVQATKDIEKGVKDIGKQAEKTDKEVEAIGATAGNSKKGFTIMRNSVRSVGVAMKTAGIGLLIAVLAGLTEAASRNKETMDKVSIVMGTVQEVFSQVSTAIRNTFNALTATGDTFTALGKVVKGVITLALTPFKFVFYELVLAAKAVKLGIEKAFGDTKSVRKARKEFKKAAKDLKQVAIDAADAAKDIANNAGEAMDKVKMIGTIAIEEFSKVSIKTANETAKAYKAATDASAIAAAQAGRLIARFDRQAEQQRQIRDNANASIKERQEANQKLNDILDEQEKQLLRQADAVIAGANAEVLKNDSIENQAALISALAAKEQVLADIEGKRSEQKSNTNTLLLEEKGLITSVTNAEKERQKQLRDFEAEQELDPLAKLQKQKSNLELENTAILEDLEAKRLLFAEGTQQRVDAEQDYLNQKQGIDNQLIANNTATNKQITENDKAAAAAKVAIQEQGLEVASQAFSLLGQLGEDNKALQATALIGESGIGIAKMIIANNTANIAALATPQAVASSGASAAPVIAFNNISTALGVAATVAATAKGLAALGEGGAPAGGDAGAGGGATAPAFNLVEGTESNAIQDSITNQDTAIKAIVVSGDVTTAQSADRNAIDSSGF